MATRWTSFDCGCYTGAVAGDADTETAEQRAFANAALTVVLTALGTLLAVAATYLLTPVLGLLPLWSRYDLALSTVAGIGYFVWLFVRLGGASATSEHRAWYRAFRQGLRTGHASGHYARGVARAVAWTDRFMGDSASTSMGLFPRAFGLTRAAPLWTAQSYHRCLLLALIYPVWTIGIAWAVWGHVGQAENALNMYEAQGWQRALALACLVAIGFAAYRINKSKRPGPAVLLAIAMLAPIWTAFKSGSGFVGVVVMVGIGIPSEGAFAVGSITAVAAALALNGSARANVVVAFVCALTLIVPYSLLIERAKKSHRFGQALAALTLVLLLAALWPLPHILADLPSSLRSLILIYFLTLLTVINAPFDWLAIGITRGLIRRGQELGGPWPLLLALLDFVLSLVLLALLAVATLWATEVYNLAAISGGARAAIIDVGGYLKALGDPLQRVDPTYFWLYAMLFSSQIPALINIAFGGFCLLRGVTPVNGWMSARLPESGGLDTWTRLGIAAVQALQLAVAVALGSGAYYAIVALLVGLIDPLFGAGLLDILTAIRITPLFG
jgi:hypothetical protein